MADRLLLDDVTGDFLLLDGATGDFLLLDEPDQEIESASLQATIPKRLLHATRPASKFHTSIPRRLLHGTALEDDER